MDKRSSLCLSKRLTAPGLGWSATTTMEEDEGCCENVEPYMWQWFEQVNKHEEDAVMTDQDMALNTQMQDFAQPSRKRSVLEMILSPIGVRPSKFMRTA